MMNESSFVPSVPALNDGAVDHEDLRHRDLQRVAARSS